MNPEIRQVLDAPHRWGLPAEVIADLGGRLQQFWTRYRPCFKSQTRDAAQHALTYLKGLLLLDNERNFANIERRVDDAERDGQRLQHFMTDSPWDAMQVIQQVQREIAQTPELAQGGVLLLDESADEKGGEHNAGAGRQHNGRLGKVEMSQVGVFLAYYKAPVWMWIDGELYLPRQWFTPAMTQTRQQLGVPETREFKTKIELGWEMVQRVKVPFVALACDDLYGRSGWFRRQLAEAHITYMAEVPATTQVYLTQPQGDEAAVTLAEGVSPVSSPPAYEVQQLVTHPETHFQRIAVRHTERGVLNDRFAMRRVWTLRDGELAEEWLVIRHENDQRYTYALSNAAADTSHTHLACLKCARHFVERSNQESKSELGWDEFQAQKYRAWEHNLALTILASWFIAQTKYEWATTYTRDPQLASQLELEVLPALSVSNVRELLQAVIPLPRLSPEQAIRLVVKHLLKRSRSTSCRLKKQRALQGPT